jgi:L,D-peptidoglycan transpeptidase YkuD (ErfK/YbiS/YcfS/YnhG family)
MLKDRTLIRLQLPISPFVVSWWRLLKTASLLAVLAAVLIAAAPMASRGPAFKLQVKPLHRVADKARKELAALAPSEELKLRPLIAEAERLTLAERIGGKSYRGRPAAEAWSAAFDQARRAVVKAKLRRADFEHQWAKLSVEAKKAVKRAADQVASTPGMARSSTRNLERAQSQLQIANAMASKGRYENAVEAARTSMEAVKGVQAKWDAIHDRFDDAGPRRQWQAWANAAVSDSYSRTSILVDKLDRRLDVLRDGKTVLSFRAELGTRGLERKLHSGDKATPEGRYKVVAVKGQGQSKYYKALLINYPNGEDVARFRNAKKSGSVPGRAGIGSLIEIHGSGGQGKDWTDGCIALRDHEMDKLFKLVGNGTPVTIVGTVP